MSQIAILVCRKRRQSGQDRLCKWVKIASKSTLRGKLNSMDNWFSGVNFYRVSDNDDSMCRNQSIFHFRSRFSILFYLILYCWQASLCKNNPFSEAKIRGKYMILYKNQTFDGLLRCIFSFFNKNKKVLSLLNCFTKFCKKTEKTWFSGFLEKDSRP